MSLVEQINTDIKTAMLAKDADRLRGLRSIKAAILLAQTETGAAENLSNEKELQVLQKLAKQRRDAIEIYKTQNRPDLEQKEQAELQVIEAFLPKMMTDDELTHALTTIIDQLKSEGNANIGEAMKVARTQLSGKADNKSISEKIKTML